MSKRTETRATRRTFLMGSAWAGLGAGLGWGGPPRIVAASANEKVRIALVGVGGMGKTHVEDEVVKQEQVVALVDVDENHLNAASEIHPGARKFSDFRAMFDAMGQGIDAVICATPDHTHAVVTARTPERLDALLRYPRRPASAYLFRSPDGRACGLAILATLPRGRTTLGRVVDLLLDDADAETWHAALLLASAELKRLGADSAQAFASPPWTTEALRRAGFQMRHPLDFSLRDRRALLPRDAPTYLTPIEADYAFG